MDTFDHNEFEKDEFTSQPQENTSNEPQQESEGTYRDTPPAGSNPQQESEGAYRYNPQPKASPYANSPYEMGQAPRNEYHYRPQTQPPVKPPREHKKSGAGRRVVAAILVVLMVAGGCSITAACVNARWEKENRATVEAMNQKIDALQQQVSQSTISGAVIQGSLPEGTALTPGQLYASCVDSVVAISSTVQTTSIYGTSEGTSRGSGFVLTEDGYIITNYHVVEGASKVEVTVHDGTTYTAKIVGGESTNDIAVLKIDASGLSAATLGSSDDLVIGDMVAAIGNPLGELTSTQTVGYVSGINRSVTTDNSVINMIQSDAAINAGNSGGPLFNMRGEVIGITTAKYSGTTGSGASIEGIGFAIPIDDVVGMISDLMDYGYVTGAYLGVTVRNSDADAASEYGLPTGAVVESINEGGSADRAGIAVKDVIIALGDQNVTCITDLTRALRSFKAGDTTTVTVLRSGAELTLDITLDEKPHTEGQSTSEDQAPMPSEGDYDQWYEYFRRYFG